MKRSIAILLLIIFFYSCQSQPKKEGKEMKFLINEKTITVRLPHEYKVISLHSYVDLLNDMELDEGLESHFTKYLSKNSISKNIKILVDEGNYMNTVTFIESNLPFIEVGKESLDRERMISSLEKEIGDFILNTKYLEGGISISLKESGIDFFYKKFYYDKLGLSFYFVTDEISNESLIVSVFNSSNRGFRNVIQNIKIEK